MKMQTALATVALVIGAGLTAVSAQPSAPSGDDVRFLHAALRDGRAEIALARSVLARTQDARAVRFAHRMIEDHTQNDAALLALEQGLSVAPASAEPDAAARAAARKLDALRDDRLGGAYLGYELQAHQNTIAALRRARTATANQQIRDYIRSTIPMEMQHYALARSLTS
jgi:predicted outer membrane protein